MRTDGATNKKLIVAFHFQFARQAAWECDACRSDGLEQRRGCPWIKGSAGTHERLVWARGPVRLTRCPVGEVTPEALEHLEHWQAARLFGFGDIAELPARTVDAFCVLENESAREKSHDN